VERGASGDDIRRAYRNLARQHHPDVNHGDPAADGRFKSDDELRAMYEAIGVTPDREVITYCQGGYRAAHTYLALRRLGYPNVKTYTGSWKEWGDREDLPLEITRRR